MQPKWLWMVLLAFLLELKWCNGCLMQERIALLQLKPFFNDFNDLHDWVNGDDNKSSNCCRWQRVECNITSRRVITLSLNYTVSYKFRKYWRLNASLFVPFKELKNLHLRDNRLIGCVENGGFEKLSLKLGNLETLDLSGNYFDNSIILSISQLSSLKFLNLANNQIKGWSQKNDIGFDRLSRLSSLGTLDLSNNILQKSILTDLGGLSSLKTLILQNCGFNGTIQLGNLVNLLNLKELDLSNNAIDSFEYPQDGDRKMRLFNLEVLDVSHNLFNSSTVLTLWGFSNLKHLVITKNKLKGSVDLKELEALSNLQELDMSGNEIDHFIASRGNTIMSKLGVVYLDGVFTNTSISLLQLVEAFPSVKTFFLRENSYFNGTAVSQVLNVQVENIFLDNSPLNSNILQTLAAFTSLKTLSLFDCGLTGILPAQGWCQYLENLEELDLSRNELHGELPSCVSNLTSLQILDISDNQLTGNVAFTAIPNLMSLRYVSLSSNRFQIPISLEPFANHSNLQVLSIDNNIVVMETTFPTWIPKFQLKVFSMSNCTTNAPISKELPHFLHHQANLTYVDLSHNNFSGLKFPSWLLQNNTGIEIFVLVNSFIDGSFQLPLHSNPKMISLDLTSNKIKGGIPGNISWNFPLLKHLFLSGNAFEGNIPACLSAMRLTHLDLSDNHLSGGIPEELIMSGLLRVLRLSNNRLSGKVMPMMLSSNRLYQLYMDGNNFYGEMPHSPISSTIGELDISSNNLSGNLPRQIWKTSYLWSLALSNNYFEGPIPEGLCSLERLQFLDLSQNKLSGSIPSCLNPPVITHVHLSRNRLSGSLTQSFFNNSALVTLDLSENDLTGNIPSWIGGLSSLSVLLLKANNFNGEVPTELCKLDSLSIVDLSRNQLTGPIPSCLSNLTLRSRAEKSIASPGYHWSSSITGALGYLGTPKFNVTDNGKKPFSNGLSTSGAHPISYMQERVEFTTKTFSYPYQGRILELMSGIDLSCNQLTGQIPFKMGNLSEIHSLNLSHNNLIGAIPSAFSKLEQIESLDLSYNSLSGTIPSQLVELHFLEVFSVAHNNLSGSIPDLKAQFGTFDESSYEGNPFLCGPPLNRTCNEPPISTNVSRTSEEQGLMNMSAFYISFAVSYVAIILELFIILCFNPHLRQRWFSYVETCINTGYLMADKFSRLSNFRINI